VRGKATLADRARVAGMCGGRGGGGGRSAANARDAALSIVVDDGGECGRRDDDG
jgi:hypothetical protein